jgi:hypothetical protein
LKRCFELSPFDDRFEKILVEMEKYEGRYGVVYEPKKASCGLCGRGVYADLHLVPLEETGSTFICGKCLQVERKRLAEEAVKELKDDETELFKESVKDRKRAAEDVFLKSYKGVYVERLKNGRIFHLKRRPLEVPVHLETGCWRFLEKYKRFFKRRGYYPLQIQIILLHIAYFVDRYSKALKYGLDLPQLDVDKQVLTGLTYTGIYNNPRILLMWEVSKKLKMFYGILPRLIGYGVFPFERCFIRASEVLRLAVGGLSTIYIETLYDAEQLLKRLIAQGGEYHHKGIVLAAFYRELLKKKRRLRSLNIPKVNEFVQAVGGVSRRQFFYVSDLFNLLKGEENMENLYREAWRLNSLRRDEVRSLLEDL